MQRWIGVFTIGALMFFGCGDTNQHLSAVNQSTKKMADELAHDRVYIESITEQLEKMATSVVELQKLFSQLATVVMTQFNTPKPEGKTEDLDQIEKEDSKKEETKKEKSEDLYKTLVPKNGDVLVQGNKCIASTVKNFSDYIKDYSQYSVRPATRYKVNFVVDTTTLLQMTKSQVEWTKKTNTETEANVWVVMRPLNITDGTIYPRFLMTCNTLESGGGFKQRCQLQPNKTHYGLDNFASIMAVKANSNLCPTRKSTLVNYQILLRGNSAQIAKIKDTALKPAGILAPVLSSFFNTETFFKNYYQNFIEETVREF